MPLTLEEVKDWLKSSRGLTRGQEDGNIDDTILVNAIQLAIKRVAKDCDLLPTKSKLPLVAGQWIYPIPENIIAVRDMWREDTNGTKLPMFQMTQEQFEAGRDPETDLTTDPTHYVYPIYEGRRIQFYAKAPDNYDYIEASRITSSTIRTVVDTGANFGRTWSGHRISPGDVVHNTTADSLGYVEVLDLITNKGSGTCGAGTDADEVVVVGTDWEALEVQEDDIICAPSTGIPTTYAFVTGVSGDTLTYEAIRGSLSAFAVGTTIKVGQAQKIRLSTAAPHRGLRSGTYNYFTVGAAALATIAGTTFTPTSCTGGATAGASVGNEAIASGGSHGYIEAVEDNTLTVTCWIGGIPAAGEVVTVWASDGYTVETRPMIQPVMWLAPTPSSSDTEGTERLWISYDIEPYLPTLDWHYLDIPQRYTDCFYACCEWQVSRQTGTHKPPAVAQYKKLYEDEVAVFGGDIHEIARGEIITVWNNRFPGNYGHANQGVVSGNIYDVAAMLEEQNS